MRRIMKVFLQCELRYWVFHRDVTFLTCTHEVKNIAICIRVNWLI